MFFKRRIRVYKVIVRMTHINAVNPHSSIELVYFLNATSSKKAQSQLPNFKELGFIINYIGVFRKRNIYLVNEN